MSSSRTQAILDALGEPLNVDGYDWSAASSEPLSAEERFQLTYATQVEWATEGTFASLNVARDPVIHDFIQVWLDQERAHAHILARLLDQCADPVAPLHTTRRQRFAAQRGRLVNAAAVRIVGEDFYAVHMSWGAVNELTTLRFYGLIRQRTEHHVLRQVLGDVMKQEAQHFAFYYTNAIERLDGNFRGQRLVRWVMTHLWTPVGVGLRDSHDVDRITDTLFVDEPGLVAQIDSTINRIPGLDGIDLMRRKRRTVSSKYR